MGRASYIYELCAQFCFEPKTALKNSLFIKKKRIVYCTVTQLCQKNSYSQNHLIHLLCLSMENQLLKQLYKETLVLVRSVVT